MQLLLGLLFLLCHILLLLFQLRFGRDHLRCALLMLLLLLLLLLLRSLLASCLLLLLLLLLCLQLRDHEHSGTY